jgi:hypothetical protein
MLTLAKMAKKTLFRNNGIGVKATALEERDQLSSKKKIKFTSAARNQVWDGIGGWQFTRRRYQGRRNSC